MRSTAAAAALLASEVGLEQPEEDGPVYHFKTTPILSPGLDYQRDTLYVTIPIMRTVARKVGKGKDAKTITVDESATACITSAREWFPFDLEHLTQRGFRFPSTFVAGDEPNWTPEAAERFLVTDTTSPDAFDLYMRVRKVYETYVEYADELMYDISALFVLYSYVYKLFSTTGYLHFNGTAASGKSQNLRILKALAFNCYWASSMSAAALYRTVAGNPGTICIDEAESFDGERGEEIRRILNAGYLDGSKVARTGRDADSNFTQEQFDTFSPKVIASINPLDNVIGSRCIVVAMRPAIRRIPEFIHDDPRWSSLRDDLYLFAMHQAATIAEKVELWNSTLRHEAAPDLVGRQWQVTQQFIVLADHVAGAQLYEPLVAYFNEYYKASQASQDATDKTRLLLMTLPRLMQKHQPWGKDFYRLKDIHEVLLSYVDDDQHDFLKTRTVSKYLDVLGFKSKRPHSGGVQVAIPEEQVREAFRQRRVEPLPDDIQWLDGTMDYQSAASHEVTNAGTEEHTASLWLSSTDSEPVPTSDG